MGCHMPEMNFMTFFLTDEGGTSSLLATALDPQFEDDRQSHFQQRFCDRLRSCEVELSPNDRPLKVYREHSDIDLVIVWGNWVLLLENKVADASVTRNQLNKYYRAVLKAMERGTFLPMHECAKKCVCVVYLTPKETSGIAEFTSLELDSARQDKKVHLPWIAILDDLGQSFVERGTVDLFGTSIRHGCELTKGILTERGKREPKAVQTPERIAAKEFLKEARQVITETMRFDPLNKLTDWNAPNLDEIYGNIASDFGNDYLTVFPNNTTLVDRDNARVNGSIAFKIAGKSPKAHQELLHSVAPNHWAPVLGIPHDSLRIDEGNSRLVFEHVWQGKYTDVLDQVTSLFCRFLLAFRPFMVAP